MEIQIIISEKDSVYLTEDYLSTESEFLSSPTPEQIEAYFNLAEQQLQALKETWRLKAVAQAA